MVGEGWSRWGGGTVALLNYRIVSWSVPYGQNTLEFAIKIWAFKVGTRLRLLLLLPQPPSGDVRGGIVYTYIIPKPNNEEITDSTIGYRRLNTIILWTSSSEW